MSATLGRKDGFLPAAFVDENGQTYGIKQTNNAPHVYNTNTETQELLDNILVSLRRLIDAQILNPTIDMASYRNRVTAVLESTTLTTCSTVTALSTVGTTIIPQAQDMVLGANLTAWALCCRERIS